MQQQKRQPNEAIFINQNKIDKQWEEARAAREARLERLDTAGTAGTACGGSFDLSAWPAVANKLIENEA